MTSSLSRLRRTRAGAVACGFAGVLAASTTLAGPPFATDDVNTPPAGHFEINLSAQYLRSQGGSAGTSPGLEINYSVTDNLQVKLATAIGFAHVDAVGTNFGPGDTTLGIKYRFIDADGDGWRPGVAFAPEISLPSGSQTRGLGNGQIGGFLPIWLTKEFDEWTVFGGGGYNINPGPDNKNWWFTGIGVTRDLSPEWTVGVELFHTTPTASGRKDSTAFNVGVIYNVNENHRVSLAVGRNIVNARENNEFSLFLNYQLTF